MTVKDLAFRLRAPKVSRHLGRVRLTQESEVRIGPGLDSDRWCRGRPAFFHSDNYDVVEARLRVWGFGGVRRGFP